MAGVILLGPRKGKYGPNGQVYAIPGANLPLATLGTLILWLGWFGFNGGSELKVSDVGEANAVALVFVNTNMAAAGGLVAALLLARFWFGKADLTMALNGALAGLVAITAEPLTPAPIAATLIGAVGGLIVVPSIVFMDRSFKIDDPVGAISVHGVVGIWGLIAVVFTNPDASLVAQLIGIGTIFAWVFVTSFVVWFAIKAITGIRGSPKRRSTRAWTSASAAWRPIRSSPRRPSSAEPPRHAGQSPVRASPQSPRPLAGRGLSFADGLDIIQSAARIRSSR